MLPIIIIMKIFVLHYSKLIERKHNILAQFRAQNITDFEFIELFDKDNITESQSNAFEPSYDKAIMSLFLKHQHVYKQITEKYEHVLILEDDVILCNNFMNVLYSYYNQLPNDYDMLFIGDGCNLHIDSNKIIPNVNIYKKDVSKENSSKCTDSFIISKRCANKLCEYANNLQKKINLPIDWWLNIVARETNCNVYWAEPTIVTQGSQRGIYNSSIPVWNIYSSFTS